MALKGPSLTLAYVLMDYLATAEALNESYQAQDWERFCKYALPVAVAAAQSRFLSLYAGHQRVTPDAGWFQAKGSKSGGGKYGDVPRDAFNSDRHQLGVDRFFARQEAEEAAQDCLLYLISTPLQFRDPDRMYRVVQVRARIAAARRHREEHGAKDRRGRLGRQEEWFRQRYTFNEYQEVDCDGESFAVQEVVDKRQPDLLQELADLEEAQLVRDTLLSSTESWAEVLSAYYFEGVPAEALQERFDIGRRGFFKRLAAARAALQSSLSTSTHV